MTFNLVARNQDDHVKNIAFLMEPSGDWRLAPAFDVIFAWEPGNRWLDSHQMTCNGKRDGFTMSDLRAVAAAGGMKRGRAGAIFAEVSSAVRRWPELAAQVGVDEQQAEQIAAAHRLSLPTA